MITYEDTVQIPDEMNISTVTSLREQLRETGSADIDIEAARIRFGAEAPNYWKLRDYVEEQADRLREAGIAYAIDFEKVTRPETTGRAAELLEHFVFGLSQIEHLDGPFPAVSDNEIPTIDADGLHITFANGERFNVVATQV